MKILILAFFIFIAPTNPAWAKTDRCEFIFDTTTAGFFNIGKGKFTNNSQGIHVKSIAVYYTSRKIESLSNLTPYDLVMHIGCSDASWWRDCDKLLENSFAEPQHGKSVGEVFIPKGNDGFLYKYQGEYWTAFFTADRLAGCGGKPGFENDRSLKVMIVDDGKFCPQAISIDFCADEAEVRKHEKNILQTINSIRFADD